MSGHGEKNRHSKGHSRPGDSRGRELVRTWKQTDRPRGTHMLETPEGGSCQGTEQNKPSEGHSLPGDARGRGLSGHGKKSTEWALTFWGQQREGLVRTQKETDQAKGTHKLETPEGGACQDTERNRLSGHSLSGDSRGVKLSGQKETDQAGGTHVLETAEGGTFQDTKKKLTE